MTNEIIGTLDLVMKWYYQSIKKQNPGKYFGQFNFNINKNACTTINTNNNLS